MHQKVLTVKEVAKQLGLGINQTYAACERGQIPSMRFGRRWVIPASAFEKWLLESNQPSALSLGGEAHD